MTETHDQNIVTELEDAMRSRSHHSSSSSSSWEMISGDHDELQEDNEQHRNKLKYDQWNCHIDKKDGRWLLIVNDKETVLKCEAHSVSLERWNELLYVKMDGHLQEVYISEDGKAKFFEGQTNILNTTQLKVEKSTKEKESVCSCQDENPKEAKYKSFSSNSENTHFENVNTTLLEQTSDINKNTDLTPVAKVSVGETSITSVDNEPKTAPNHVETNRVIKEISDIDSFGVSEKAHDSDRQSSGFYSSREENQVSELASLSHEAVSDDINLIQKDKDVTKIQESNVVTLTTALDPNSETNIVTQTPENINMPSVTNTPVHKDGKDADVLSLPHETRSCKTKLIKTENHWILCVDNTETVLEFDVKDNISIEIGDENVYLQANNTRYEVTFDKTGEVTIHQLQETRVISALPCSEPQAGAQMPKSAGVQSVTNTNASGNVNKEELDLNTIRQGYEAGTANQTIIGAKEPTDKGNLLQISQPLIELLKKGKDRLLVEGKAETTLELDDGNKVPMYFVDCNYYIKLNKVLYEVKFETDGETFIVPIKEAEVISSTAGSPGAVAENTEDTCVSDHEKERDPFVIKADKHENVYDKEETVAKKIQCDEKVDVASPNNEREQSSKLPKLADDGVSALTDMFGKMGIENAHDDGMFKSSSLTSGNQCLTNDRKNNTLQDSDENKCLMYGTKDANVNIYETAVSETQTSASNKQPNATINSTHPGHVHSTSDTEMEKASMTVMDQKNGQNAESGARPKQARFVRQDKTASLRVRNTTKDVVTSHSQQRLASTFSAAVVPTNEYGPGDKEIPRSTRGKDSIEEKTDLKLTQSPVAKEESKQGSEILSTAVQVKNMEHFNFLKDSKYITQLAKMNGVKIKSLQITDCQGFEITGEPYVAQKCENELKKVIENIRSASVKLEGGRNSISETKDNMSQMKSEVEKTFDVSLEFSAQTASKHYPDNRDLNAKPSHSTSKRVGEDEENHIQKVEKPNFVSWRFPGGYRISLRKESVEQSSAVVHVEFTSWNGKDKQLIQNVIDDGMGGYTLKIKAGLPRRRERNETEELKQLFEKILEKAGEDEHNSVAFSIGEMQNWNSVSFHESLIRAVWKQFKAPKRYKPVFIELCNPHADEYEAANYQCHRLISTEMETEIGCIKCRPLEIRVTENKLNCTEAEVLVNTTSKELMLAAGAVSHALLKTGGVGLQIDCSTYYPKGINWGEMAITRGHGLRCKYVFHGALPPYPMQLNEVEKLTAFRQLMDSCLTTAAELGCSSIAFPVLGAGNLKYPVDLVASEMFTGVQKFQQTYKSTTLQTVYFVVYPSDKAALQKFRQIESDLKGVAGAKKKEQAAHAKACEQEKTDEDVVCNVVVELTGQDSAVQEAIEFTKSKWRNLHSEEQHLYAMRLPARLGQDLCIGQHGAAKQLKELGVAVSMTDSNYFIRVPTLQILKQSCLIVNQFAKRYGQQLDLIREGTVIVKIQNVSKTDFKVLEKMCRSTLDKYAKSETKVRHNGNGLEIEGKAEYADSCRTEIQRLISYIQRLETCCVPVDEHKIAKIDEILKEVHTGKYNACILTEAEKCQIRLFSKHDNTLNDLKNEILDKIKSSTSKQINIKLTKHDHQQARAGSETTGTHLHTRQHTGNFPIRIKTSSGELKLYVYEGDLLKSKVVCIVNAANEYLSHNAGVAAAIANAAGPELVKESVSHFRRYRKVSVGKTVLTTAGNLNYRCVIHAVGPNWRDYMPMSQTKLQECKLAIQSAVRQCLDEMQNHNLKSVAIPAVSSGYQGVPRDICALEYAKAIDQYLKETSRPIVEEIHFVDMNSDTVSQIAQTFYDFFVNKKVVSCDHKYLSTEQKAPVMTAPLHPEKGAVKNTGRSKTNGHGSHPGGSTSSARAELHSKTEDATTGAAVTSQPFVYQSSMYTTVIHVSSNHELQLYTGNILELKSVDTIVVREDLAGTAKSRIALGMVEKGGPPYVSAKGTAFKVKPSFGDVIVTNGGNSRFKYVFHALVHHRQHFTKDSSKWYDAFRKILGLIYKKAVLFKCHDIAMPVLRIDDKEQSDIPEYAKVMVESYKRFCSENTTQKLTVHLISKEPSLTTVLQSAFHHVISNKQPVSGSSVAVYPPTVADNLKTGQAAKKEEQTATKATGAPTKMERSPRKEQVLSESTSKKEKEDCVICLDEMALPKKLPCGHTFCKDCISQHMKTKKNCPICGKVFGEITGNQPKGQMNIHRLRTPLPGYERYDTIVIDYVFPSGIQGPEHPDPGKPYRGISRTAYLPDNTDGRQILNLLSTAFARKLTFTIGQSRTTGNSGVITWNDIHHKTNPKPNTQFGYPDPEYFDRVKDELAAKGVTIDDIK